MIQMITPLSKEEFSADRDAKRASVKICRCISELKAEVRELIFALDIFEPVAIAEELPIFTNGKNLFYSPAHVLKEGVKTLKHRILHITFHALLDHIEKGRNMADRELAGAVMDLKVERMIRFIYGGDAESESDIATDIFGACFKRRGTSAKKESVGLELYYRALKNKDLRKRILESGEKAASDDHNAWNAVEIQLNAAEWGDAASKLMELMSDGNFRGDSGGTLDSFFDDLIEKSQKQSRYGNTSGNRSCNVLMEAGMGSDYRDILGSLRKIAVTYGEEDVPDPVFYSYGLELYGDIPLVEPLEEAEKPGLGTVVIAVDTSGSCADKLPVFLRETDAILEELKRSVNIKNLLYMECDSVIQKEIMVEGNETGELLGTEHMYEGYGGTDFRPVFDRIEEYRSAGIPIDCLIYYSDGEGEFPRGCVDYPCIFILPETGGYGETQIPDWVEKKYLSA